MQARIEREGEIVVVHLSGRIDIETSDPFREACLSHLKETKVIFDFTNLSFVGSTGLMPFIGTIQDFSNSNSKGVKLSGLGSEFRKLFSSFPLGELEIFDTHSQAINSYVHPFTNSAVLSNRPTGLEPEGPVPAWAAPIQTTAEMNQEIDSGADGSDEFLSDEVAD